MPARIPNLSATRISTFEQCAKYYQFQYVLRAARSFTPVEWEVGSIVHEVISRLFRQVRDRHRSLIPRVSKPDWYQPLLGDALARLRGSVEEGAVRIIRPDTPLAYHEDEIARALSAFTGQVLPQLEGHKVIGIESDLGDFALGSVPVVGRLDLVTQAGANTFVHDWKTGKRRAEDLRQARLYFFGAKAKYRQPSTTFVFYHLLEAGEPAEWFVFPPQEREALEKEVARLVQEMEAETAFAPRVSVLCHWCPFGPQCEAGTAWMSANPPPSRDAELDLGF